MEKIFFMALLAGALGILAAFLGNRRKGREYEKEVENRVAVLNEEELLECRMLSVAIVADQMQNPKNSEITYNQAKKALLEAVWCEDRLNTLNNLEHGSTFRAKRKISLTKEVYEYVKKEARKFG